MSRRLSLLILAAVLLSLQAVFAQDDGPPIAITSPDTATTFVYGTIKSHELIWDKKKKMLVAVITFTDIDEPNDDTHEFRLPGITFDQAKGLFFATTAKGELIPVARLKKGLFTRVIETTPNAVVRVLHPKGNITVILEAISPDDPAMHSAPADSDSDVTHQVDINKILN
ncbi:MAG TPA: hypothetical protein VGZ93_09570 [Candidatus Methylacidiphilales bacterium]|nr:hypothetical protein [Candidatus Methylacidiphilales bacterium]